MELNVPQFWNFIAVLAVLATAGVFLFRLNQQAYIKALRETSEGWKAAHDLKVKELEELRGRVATIEHQLNDRNLEYQTVLKLNIALQQDLRERDARIAELQTQVGKLQLDVANLSLRDRNQ